MAQVLDEFLVKISTSVDEASFAKFNNITKFSGENFSKFTVGIATSLVKASAEITAGLVAISGSVLGVTDKVVSANTSFRLFGQSMLLDTKSARELKMVTDALGISIEQIYWDKLSQQKAAVLRKDIQSTINGLKDYESVMGRAELLQFQLTSRLTNAFKLIASSFTYHLFKDLGGTDLLKTVTGTLNSLLEGKNIDSLGKKLSSFFTPILKETYELFKVLGVALKDFSNTFSELIGDLSGDTSIKQSTSSFEKLGKSLVHVIHWGSEFVKMMSSVAQIVLHAASAIVYAFKAIWDAVHLDFSGAIKDLGQSLQQVQTSFASATPGSGAVGGGLLGMGIGGLLGGLAASIPAVMLAPETMGASLALIPLGSAMGAATLGTLGAGAGAAAGSFSQHLRQPNQSFGLGNVPLGQPPGVKNAIPSKSVPSLTPQGFSLEDMKDSFRGFFGSSDGKTSSTTSTPLKTSSRVGMIPEGLQEYAKQIQNAIPNFREFTAGIDRYHQIIKPGSAHNLGRALDFTLKQAPSVREANEIARMLKENFGATQVLDEYHRRSSGSTGPHFHVEFPEITPPANNLRSSVSSPTNIDINVNVRTDADPTEMAYTIRDVVSRYYEDRNRITMAALTPLA